MFFRKVSIGKRAAMISLLLLFKPFDILLGEVVLLFAPAIVFLLIFVVVTADLAGKL